VLWHVHRRPRLDPGFGVRTERQQRVLSDPCATVSYAGLDLGTAQGAAALLDRIDAAARVVCGEKAGRKMNETRTKLFDNCLARTTADAVKAVNVPQLTQVAASR